MLRWRACGFKKGSIKIGQKSQHTPSEAASSSEYSNPDISNPLRRTRVEKEA